MLRLFTTGTHNGSTYTNERLASIFTATKEKGSDRIPFVLGHPKNDLPVLGWISKDKLQQYKEGDKVSIGFEKEDAVFSDESIAVLKKQGMDKISVRIQKGVIRHIGLVDSPAVKENETQDFEAMTGDFNAIDSYPIEAVEKHTIEKIFDYIKDFTKTKTQNTMSDQEKKTLEEKVSALEAQKKQLEDKIAEKEKQAEEAKKANQEKEQKEIEAKIDATKLSDEEKKEAKDFAKTMVENGKSSQFGAWLEKLTNKSEVKVLNGSVLPTETADFAKQDPRAKAEAEMKTQIEKLKNQ